MVGKSPYKHYPYLNKTILDRIFLDDLEEAQ